MVGRDPRASGEFLEAAVVAGLASAGVDVLRLGVIPTPGVAYLTGALNASFGVVISASHNPAADNGIKFFGRGGVKLPDATEDAIEARLGERGSAARPAGRRSAGSATPAPCTSCTWTTCSPRCRSSRSRRWRGCGSWPTARTAPRT